MKKRLLLSWILLGLALLPALPGRAQAADQPVVVVAELKGAVSPAMTQFVERVLSEARTAQAQAVVFQLDTPGGLVEAMREVVKLILASPLPVMVYVAPQGARAASAGVLITLAAHVAAMAPGTNIGAAHPVDAGGKDVGGEMARKVTNDMVAYARSIAEQRGRNADWAEEAVLHSVSLPAVDAVAEGVVDLVASDLEALLAWAHGREVKAGQGQVRLNTQEARLIHVTPGFRDKLLEFLANPNLAYLLLMIGLLAVYFELSHPGAILPGVVGAIALILAFMAMQTLSVSLAGVLLIMVGVVLFIIELKVQSYGLLPLAGIGCLTVGSIMLFEKTEEGVRLAWTTVVPTVAVVSAFFIGVLTLVWRAQRRKPVTGAEGLLGLSGEVVAWSGGQGKVFVHGELWRAKGEPGLNPHDKIQVAGQEGLTLLVKPAGKEA